MLRRTLEMRHMYPVDGVLRNTSQNERVFRRVQDGRRSSRPTLTLSTVSKARSTPIQHRTRATRRHEVGRRAPPA